ncbi:MAG: 50S ribosomal protein L5 [Candidatus Hydrogenedens sp.]|nr:50S ribosomal protein L5 [Candidatus Hydrogenedens sp.]
MAATLKTLYAEKIVPALREQFGYKNIMEVPLIEKVTINMGVGDAIQDSRFMDAAVAELTMITGQKAVSCTARKSISNFKLRQGQKIGCKVTLRGDRMYEFMERLFTTAIPRIPDFRGTSVKAFDKQFNYTLGLKEQGIFPEINMDEVGKPRGMNVTFTIKNARSADESRELLRLFGMPFRKN